MGIYEKGCFVGIQGALKTLTKIKVFQKGVIWMVEIERKPYKSKNPRTGEIEVKHFEVLTELADLHKRLIHDVITNPCKWE